MLGAAPASSPGPVRLGRYRDVMWSPPDPDGPTSELYRLMPPQHLSTGRPDDGDPIVVISPRQRWWRELAARARPASHRAAGWVWTLATLTLAGFLSLVIYASLSG